MASTTAVTSSISSTAARRLHYQAQISNTSLSLSQSFSVVEPSNIIDTFSSPAISINPLVTIVYSNSSLSQDNQQLLLNSYASCRRLLDHMKQVVGINNDDTIDLMDNEGKLKELNMHYDDYATQFLTARSTYYVLKVEADPAGEKRYVASFNLDQIDQKLNTILTNSLNTLNKSVSSKIVKRPTATSRQNTAVQSSSSTPQTKGKRPPNRKQN